MPAGTKVSNLVQKLESLDIDEGIRVESRRAKMFVNRSPSSSFIVQSSDAFHYLDTAGQVAKLVRMTFKSYSAWAYWIILDYAGLAQLFGQVHFCQVLEAVLEKRVELAFFLCL